MFNGFSPKTSEFLWDLAFNNERPWFLAHKEEFEEVLNRPFRSLANDTFALMQQRFPRLECELHIARIYRDARRLFGRGPYKDHLWFSIKCDPKLLSGPMFWFEIGAADYSYGMGFYDASAQQMECYRRLIDANPARFERIIRSVERGGEFTVSGEEYKRPKAEKDEPIARWYNRKRIAAECSRDFDEALYDPELPQKLVESFAKLMPLYDFCTEFYRMAASAQEEKN